MAGARQESTVAGFAVRRGARRGRPPGFRRAVLAAVLLAVLGGGLFWLDRTGALAIERREEHGPRRDKTVARAQALDPGVIVEALRQVHVNPSESQGHGMYARGRARCGGHAEAAVQ